MPLEVPHRDILHSGGSFPHLCSCPSGSTKANSSLQIIGEIDFQLQITEPRLPNKTE